MRAFLYSVALQWRLDIRSKSLLVTCYIVPLLFFVLMSGIFTSVMPDMRGTLIQSMLVMGVSMGAFTGMPSALVEVYGGDVQKVYKANGVSLYLGLASMVLSAFAHLLLMCAIVCVVAPLAFGAALPPDMPRFLAALVVYIAASLSIGCVLGLAVRNQSKLTAVEQFVFLPSIMLSGIMFPAELLPGLLEAAGRLLPAAWGYRLMLPGGLRLENLWYPLLVLLAAAALCGVLLRRRRAA